jgi:hypothetical protein
MWPVYLLSIFVEGAWAWFPRVDAWGTRQLHGWGDFFRGHSRLVTNFGGPSEELDGSFDLRLCARRWKHQQSHDKSDNYSESNLEKPSNRGLGGPVVDFNQNDD